MNFDIKDVKSWATRKDVKIGDKGYFCKKISDLHDLKEKEYSKIESINDNQANCFFSTAFYADCFSSTVFYGGYSFFLPLDAVKKDKPKKKYRPFKSMSELTEIIYSKEWRCDDLSVGDNLWIRRKSDEHVDKNLLIISLEYNENDLISMNGRLMQDWLDEFEFLARSEWVPFGVEVTEE